MSYIGNSPGVASQRVVTNLTATSGQTRFVAQSGYTLGYIDVLRNGIDLVLGEDYTATDGIGIDLTVAAAVGDKIKLVAYIPRGLSDGWTKDEADARFVNTTADTVALAANGFSVGTNQLVVNSGNVGIGTASPSSDAPLHIYSTAGGIKRAVVQNNSTTANTQARFDLSTGTANSYAILSLTEDGVGGSNLQLSCGSGVNGGIYITTATNSAPFIIRQSGAERLRVSSAGILGIGASNPVGNGAGDAAFTGGMIGSSDGGYFGGGAYYNAGWKNSVGAQGGWVIRNTAGVFTILTGSSPGTAGTAFTDFAERLRITATGDVLIGTASSSGKLSIQLGTYDIVAGLGGNFPMWTYRNGTGSWFHAGKHPIDNAFVITQGATPTSFELSRIDTSGNVMYGVTSAIGKLSVRAGSADNTISAYFSTSDSNVTGVSFRHFPSGNTTMLSSEWSTVATSLSFGVGGGEKLRIDPNGRITMPYQPAFYAHDYASTAVGTMIFSSTRFNIGSHYNTTNGRFTAPVAGRYMFIGQLFITVDGGTRQINLHRNGASLSEAKGAGNGSYTNLVTTQIVNLSVGDYVTLYYSSGGAQLSGADYTYLEGYLIG